MNKNLNNGSLFSSITRRNFIRAAGGCGAMSGISALSTLLDLRLTASVMAQQPSPGDYKALVCVFLFGGNDSFNMLAPYDELPYNGYVSIRRGRFTESGGVGVALPRDIDLDSDPSDPNYGMSLKPIVASSGAYGIHGYFNAGKNSGIDGFDDNHMQGLYKKGELAFVANVGSAPRPVDKSNWDSNRPVGLFSHSDEQRNWMTSLPQSRAESIGWGGRMADVLSDSVNLDSKIGMGIALGGNAWMRGAQTSPYIVSTGGATKLGGYGGGAARNKILTSATDGLLSQQYANLLEMTHAGARKKAIDAAIEYSNATQGIELLTDNGLGFGAWPTYSFAAQLKQVAKAIAAREQLGQERQIFFVSRGGFDNHSNLINNHTGSMPQIGEGLYRFTEELRAQNVLDQVTTFTMSDFGRTLVGNDNKGADHAWGSNQLVIGGAVKGGEVHGTYPDMSEPANFNDKDGLYTTDRRGRMIPSTSVDQYVKELVEWFGVSPSDLSTILPNIGNFPDSLDLMA